MPRPDVIARLRAAATRSVLAIAVALVAVGVSPRVAHAAPITYYFSGSFLFAGGGITTPALENTEFFGSFTYDPTISLAPTRAVVTPRITSLRRPSQCKRSSAVSTPPAPT